MSEEEKKPHEKAMALASFLGDVIVNQDVIPQVSLPACGILLMAMCKRHEFSHKEFKDICKFMGKKYEKLD